MTLNENEQRALYIVINMLYSKSIHAPNGIEEKRCERLADMLAQFSEDYS